jgi:hypothetical protein
VNKQSKLLVYMLFLSFLLSSMGFAQVEGNKAIEVFLESPSEGSTTGSNVFFAFRPILYGDDDFTVANLIINSNYICIT